MDISCVVKANMKSKKGTMISIFLFLFLTSLVLITVFSISVNADMRYEDASEKVGIPDITTVIKNDLISPDLKAGLEEDPSVDYVEMVPMVYVNQFRVQDKVYEEIQGIGIYQPTLHPYEIYQEDGLGLIEDNHIIPQRGEIFIPIASKNRYKCEVGDTITYTFENKSKSFKISKFIEEPYSGCALMGMKRVFINAQDYEELESLRVGNQKEIQIYFTQSNTELSDSILRRLSQKENISDIGTNTLLKEDSKMFTMIFTKILSGILLAFSILLFVIILIIIGFSINMSIEMDYKELGIYKALGFTTGKLRVILMLQYLVSGSAGCLLGLIFSGIGIKYISRFFVPITGLFISSQIDVKSACSIIFSMLTLLTIYIFYVTKKMKKIYPMEAISKGMHINSVKALPSYDITEKKNMSLTLLLTIKNLIGGLNQYIRMGLIMGLLLFFLTTTSSIKQIKNYDNVRTMYGGASGEIQIIFEDIIRENIVADIVKEINKITPVNKVFKSDLKYFSVDGLQYLANIVSQEGILKKPFEGREPQKDDEIVVTEILSAILGKGIGDTVVISQNQKQKEYRIVGLNQDSSDVGKCFGILETGVRRLDNTYKISNIDISIQDEEMTSEIIEWLKGKFDETENGIEFSNQYQNIIDQSIFIIVAIDGITALIFLLALFFVALITLIICSKVFISERIDMGITKSLGFSTTDIRIQFSLRFFLVSLIGSFVGVVINIVFGKKLMKILFHSMGMGRGTLKFRLIDYIIPVVFLCGFTLVFSWLSSRKIKKVSPKNLINL